MSISVVEYNSRWPQMFEQERNRLYPLLVPWLASKETLTVIEHVGSTAVPGLLAKPVIDIMVGVESLEASRPAIEVLEQAGYCYYPYKPEQMHWFCKPSPDIRTHHVHLIPFHSTLWHTRLKFRDRLRHSPQLTNEYARLKQGLARQYAQDREAYTQGKGAFVEQVVSGTKAQTPDEKPVI